MYSYCSWCEWAEGTIYVQTNRGGVTNINLLIQHNLTILSQKPVFHRSAIIVHNYSTWKKLEALQRLFLTFIKLQKVQWLVNLPLYGIPSLQWFSKTSYHITEMKMSHSMLMFSDDELPSTTKKKKRQNLANTSSTWPQMVAKLDC